MATLKAALTFTILRVKLFIDAIDYPLLLTYPGPLPVNPVKASN
jgi:hypothetical protein